MRLSKSGALSIALTICLVVITGCGDSECDDARNAFNGFTSSSVEARNKVNADFLAEKLKWAAEKKQLTLECETDVIAFAKKNGNVRSSLEFWGTPSEYKKIFGVSICESAADLPPSLPESRFDFADSEYLNSQRVIVNNQRCFAAEEVARAQMNLSGS